MTSSSVRPAILMCWWQLLTQGSQLKQKRDTLSIALSISDRLKHEAGLQHLTESVGNGTFLDKS